MEDVQLAWAAVRASSAPWSNGNSGPACQTSGSPGSRIINYSVGAYDINNNIAGFSARGAGQDGEIKPNISRPGRQRPLQPARQRATAPSTAPRWPRRTSRARSRCCGRRRRRWSATSTRPGRCSTAPPSTQPTTSAAAPPTTTTSSARAGSTPWPCCSAAPVGDTGTLAGTVTDAATGDPIAGADGRRSPATSERDADHRRGRHATRSGSPPATTPVTVSAFGYADADRRRHGRPPARRPRQDFALAAAPMVTVSGTVTDGSGHDWPLYAKVDRRGRRHADDYTDPSTGALLAVSCPAGATYTLTVDVAVPGLPAVDRGGHGRRRATRRQDVALAGGQRHLHGARLRVQHDGAYRGLRRTARCRRAGRSWTTRATARCGVRRPGEPRQPDRRHRQLRDHRQRLLRQRGSQQDTSLVSPVVDMSALTAPVVGFKQDFNQPRRHRRRRRQHRRRDDLDDGPAPDDRRPRPARGRASRCRRRPASPTCRSGSTTTTPATTGGGRSTTCSSATGHLRPGRPAAWSSATCATPTTRPDQRRDRHQPATSRTRRPSPRRLRTTRGWTTASTGCSPRLTGAHPFKATAKQTTSQTKPGQRRRRLGDHGELPARGRPPDGDADQPAARRRSSAATASRKTFTVTNDGDRAGRTWSSASATAGSSCRRADGIRIDTDSRSPSATGAPLQRDQGADCRSPPGVRQGRPTGAPAARVGPHDGSVDRHRRLPVDGDGQPGRVRRRRGLLDRRRQRQRLVRHGLRLRPGRPWRGRRRPSLPGARNAMAVGAVDGQIVATGGWAAAGPSADTWVYDPAGDAWTAGGRRPGVAVRVRSGGRRRQAVRRRWLHHRGLHADVERRRRRTTRRPTPGSTLADYPTPVAFASCGGIDGKVYCTGGNGGAGGHGGQLRLRPGCRLVDADRRTPRSTPGRAAYAVANGMLVVNGGVAGRGDHQPHASPTTRPPARGPTCRTPTPLATAAGWRAASTRSAARPVASPRRSTARRCPGFEECAAGAADVEWMTIDRTSATPGTRASRSTVRVTMDPNVAQPGTYTAGVAITEDAPGSVDPVAVTMKVNAADDLGQAGRVRSPARSCTGDDRTAAGGDRPGRLVGRVVDVRRPRPTGTYAYWFSTAAQPARR